MSADNRQMLSDLLSISGRALGANPNLITISLCIKFGLLSLWGLLVFLIVAASAHGTIEQNPYAIPNPAGGDTCIQTAPANAGGMGAGSSSEGSEVVPCCSWAMTGDAITYIVFAALFMLWCAAAPVALCESLRAALLAEDAQLLQGCALQAVFCRRSDAPTAAATPRNLPQERGDRV